MIVEQRQSPTIQKGFKFFVRTASIMANIQILIIANETINIGAAVSVEIL